MTTDCRSGRESNIFPNSWEESFDTRSALRWAKVPALRVPQIYAFQTPESIVSESKIDLCDETIVVVIRWRYSLHDDARRTIPGRL